MQTQSWHILTYMKSKYLEALDYLYSFTDYEKQSGYTYSPDRFDLRRVERLLELLGNPHRTFKAVHGAGTKGKGSTSAMIASILQAAGYRTALYTSPHLHTFRERMRLDGELIAERAVIRGVERLRSVAPQVPEITTFELITALAFDYFASPSGDGTARKAEWAVLEVGMGGRLDATNVVTPLASVITSISYDHVMYLGDTLAAIAAEKAGIIKPGVPVISAPQPIEALQVIERTAEKVGTSLTLVGRDWQHESIHTSAEGQRFLAFPTANRSGKRAYALPLLGQHQQVNATTALATIAQLRKAGLNVPDEVIYAGLRSVRWPGRLEILGRRPWVIADGAHNGDSMQKLRAALTELFKYKDMILVFGASADKDVDGMLDAILPAATHVLVTQARHPRAAAPEALIEHISTRGKRARAIPVGQVLGEALALADEDDLICVTGSLFVIAELRAAWFKYKRQPLPPSDPLDFE